MRVQKSKPNRHSFCATNGRTYKSRQDAIRHGGTYVHTCRPTAREAQA